MKELKGCWEISRGRVTTPLKELAAKQGSCLDKGHRPYPAQVNP